MIHKVPITPVAITPETLKEQWSALLPRVKDRWPKLTDQDLREINGDLDKLVSKLDATYGLKKADAMNDLTTLLQPAEKVAVGKPGEKQG